MAPLTVAMALWKVVRQRERGEGEEKETEGKFAAVELCAKTTDEKAGLFSSGPTYAEALTEM